MEKISLGRFSRQGCVAILAALCMVVFATTAVFANTVHIYDNVNVLNKSSVQQAASALSKPVDIYAVNSSLSSSAFDQHAKTLISSSNLIVIAFDSSHVSIVGGSSVGLSDSQYQDAVNAFLNTMSNGSKDYSGATVAALNSLNGSLGGGGAFSSGGGGGSSIFGGNFCCIGLLVLLIIGVIAFTSIRRRRRFGMNQGFNQGYGAGNYPPNYPQNQYYQDPNMQGGRRGMNPWAAGGIGAALGGLFGYGLGREGDRDNRGGNYGGDGGNFGNGGDGGFGGGASGDFGGGDNNGGGGDGGFGGGAGGDFGGGGGFGGDSGGGGGDGGFGGGAGGNF